MGIVLWIALSVTAFVLLGVLRRKLTQRAPGPLGLPIVGNLFVAARNKERWLDYILENTIKYGSVWTQDMNGIRYWIISDPECCDYFLKQKFAAFERGPHRLEQLGELLGNGIFNANGKEWKLHRGLAKHLFRSDFIDRCMVPEFAKHAAGLLDTLRSHAESGEPLEICQMFMRYTMASFLSLGLGCEFEEKDMKEFAAAFDYAQREVSSRAFVPFWKWRIPASFTRAIQTLDDFVYRTIEKRKSEGIEALKDKTDIMSQFLVRTDDNGQPFTPQYLRDVFINFLLAGRDTTAALLTWTFYVLSREPGVKKRLIEEINEKVQGDVPTAEEVHQLEYSKRLLTEVLRLYPSVPLDGREAVEDTVLPDGTLIKKGEEAWYLPYVQGRLLYEDPMRFDPDRWLPDRAKALPRGLFTAFHLGPQTCLGKDMAYVEARVALASVIKAGFDLALIDESYVPRYAMPNPILVPLGGLHMRVKKSSLAD